MITRYYKALHKCISLATCISITAIDITKCNNKYYLLSLGNMCL